MRYTRGAGRPSCQKHKGNALSIDEVDSFKQRLTDHLEKSGYAPVIYTNNSDISAIAYTDRPVELRREAILIDDGGTRLLDSGKYSPRVLKIAIRDAQTLNRALDQKVLEMLKEAGVDRPAKGELANPEKGTKVYALFREYTKP